MQTIVYFSMIYAWFCFVRSGI